MVYAISFLVSLLGLFFLMYFSHSAVIFTSLIAVYVACIIVVFYIYSEKNREDDKESISIPDNDFFTDLVIHKRIDDLTKDKVSSDYTIYAKLVVNETGEESNVFTINNHGVKEGIIRESMKEYDDLLRTLQAKKIEDLF